MLEGVLKFFKLLFDFWQVLPSESKEDVKKILTEGFESLFRNYYRAETKGKVNGITI